MDTIVHTREAIALDGIEARTELRVPDSKMKVDEAGCLHVHHEERGQETGSITFAPGVWIIAVRGDLVFNNDGGLMLVRRHMPHLGES